jgi:hypothetical protein
MNQHRFRIAPSYKGVRVNQCECQSQQSSFVPEKSGLRRMKQNQSDNDKGLFL